MIEVREWYWSFSQSFVYDTIMRTKNYYKTTMFKLPKYKMSCDDIWKDVGS